VTRVNKPSTKADSRATRRLSRPRAHSNALVKPCFKVQRATAGDNFALKSPERRIPALEIRPRVPIGASVRDVSPFDREIPEERSRTLNPDTRAAGCSGWCRDRKGEAEGERGWREAATARVVRYVGERDIIVAEILLRKLPA